MRTVTLSIFQILPGMAIGAQFRQIEIVRESSVTGLNRGFFRPFFWRNDYHARNGKKRTNMGRKTGLHIPYWMANRSLGQTSHEKAKLLLY